MQTLEVGIKYKPFPEQLEFHRDRYKVRHRAVFSGVGGGKTICGLAEVIRILLENPKAVAYGYEPTYKMVRRVLIPALESKLIFGAPIESNPIVNSFHRGDGYLELLQGQTFWFGSLEEPEYGEGVNIDVGWMDEAQYIRKFKQSHDIVLRRLRGSGKTDRDITQSIITTTPPPLLPNCALYDFFENPETRDPNSKVYRWSMLRNPYTTEEYKREMQLRHTGNYGKQFIDGLFAPVGTGSFDFDSTIHELKSVSKEILRDIIYGVDFGWTNPSAVIVVGFDGDGRAYILDEFYQNRVQTETLIEELKEMQENWGKGKIYCDKSEPQTIDMFRKAGLNAYPDASKREDGIHELGGRFHVQADGRPRLYVLSNCVNWIHEVMVYDVEVKENDHAVDATRYAIMNHKPPNKPAWILI